MEYTINSTNKTIYVTFTGPVDAHSLIHHILEIRSEKHFQAGYNIIVDLRKATVPRGYMEVAEVAEFVKVTTVVRETFRMAILVENDAQIRSARLYKLLSSHDHTQVCESIHAAEAWIGRATQRDGHIIGA